MPGRDLDGTRRVFVDRLHPGWASHTLYRGKVKIFTSIFSAAYETFRLHPVPFAYGSKPDQRTARRKSPDSSGLPADERPPAADSTELGETPSPTSTPFSPTDPAAGRPAGPLVCSDPAATAAPSGDGPSPGSGAAPRRLRGPRRPVRVFPLVRPTRRSLPPAGRPGSLRVHPTFRPSMPRSPTRAGGDGELQSESSAGWRSAHSLSAGAT